MREIGNNGYAIYKRETTSREEEMAALECFGPLTREAIMNAPISILAYGTLNETIAEYEKVKAASIAKLKERYPNITDEQLPKFPELNLKRPDVDAGIARGIMMSAYHMVIKDREKKDNRTKEERERDAALSLQPIVTKRLRRSVR